MSEAAHTVVEKVADVANAAGEKVNAALNVVADKAAEIGAAAAASGQEAVQA